MNDLHIGRATILIGDCIERMKDLPDGSVQTCVTSPPYFGLRDYGVDGQIGLEQTPDEYVAKLVDVFREVRRVLADDGTLWLNLGDSYASARGKAQPHRNTSGGFGGSDGNRTQGYALAGGGFERPATVGNGVKAKDLIGIPWRVAFALQADGWYLRQDIIWHKPNPMPESVRDRCTKAHEYVFLLSKSERYFYDHEAVKEPAVSTHGPGNKTHRGATAYHAGDEKHRTKVGLAAYADRQRNKAQTFKREGSKREQAIPGQSVGTHRLDRNESTYDLETRNRRSVWTVATRPYKGAHFAVFPPALIEPCILAGSRPGDTVLDPFNGSGTTGQVCIEHGRQYLGIELNPDYLGITRQRLEDAIDARDAAIEEARIKEAQTGLFEGAL